LNKILTAIMSILYCSDGNGSHSSLTYVDVETCACTNKERLHRRDTYYGNLAQFRERVPRQVFRVSCLVAINFGVCILGRPTVHTCTCMPICTGTTITKTLREQRHTNFPSRQLTRAYLRCSPYVLIISPISISAAYPYQGTRFSSFNPILTYANSLQIANLLIIQNTNLSVVLY